MKIFFIVLAIVLAIAAAACFGLSRVLFYRMLTRTGVTREKEKEKKDTSSNKMREFYKQLDIRREALLACAHETWSIRSQDGLTLRARCIPAERETERWAICVHGYTATGPNEYAWFFDFYRRLGFNLLLPDNRAHGQSDGEYIGMGVLDSEDIRMWIDELLRRTRGKCRIALHGVSMGAATVLTVAGKEELPRQIYGAIADCGYTSVWDQFTYQLRAMFHLPPFPVLHMASAICRVRAGYGFKDFSPLDAVKKARIPILFVHGDADDFVPTRMGRELYQACRSEKELLIVPGAAHAQSYRTDPRAYEDVATTFLEKIGMGESK